MTVNAKHDTASFENCGYKREIFDGNALYDGFLRAKQGVITPVAFENWYKSWFKGHYKIMSKLQRQNLDTLFNQLKEVLENVQNHSE